MWSPPSFPAVEVHVGVQHESVMPRHVHDEIQIGAYEGGTRQFRVGSKDVEAGAVSIVVIPSGEPHAGRSQGAGSTFRVMFIQAALFDVVADEVGRRASDLSPFAGASPSYATIIAVVEALARGTKFEQEGLPLELVDRLLKRHATDARRPRREPRAVRAAKAYLREHLDGLVSLGDLAREVGLSEYYLLRAFRDEVGIPKHAYLTHRRVERGKELLRSGVPPIDVAAALGFVDQSHFSRQFRRYVGASPKHYQHDLLTRRGDPR